MPAGDPLRHLEAALAELSRRDLLRNATGAPPTSSALLNLCSNDYLGYSADPWPDAQQRGGAGASRLVSGTDPAHDHAEQTLASWLGTESALLFSSGYAANVGTLAALAGPGDLICSDALNHASLVDGCRLSGATIQVIAHRDLSALERALTEGTPVRRRWVVTESYFSMDGDSPDLPALRALCTRHDAALIVDEAHALGVFGPHGRGLCAEASVTPDVLIGTAGKSLGLQGAFVAGSTVLRTWLWNRARSFVFSTAISPALAGAIATRAARAAADDAGRARLRALEAQLRHGLARLRVPGILDGRGPIFPWIVGEPSAALALSGSLRDQGVLVQAIRPPTVPAHTSRLRITVHAGLTSTDVERALAAFQACC
ncbi:MAG: 8-amino-7-oxononanoate synthase [Minicystis sp.]